MKPAVDAIEICQLGQRIVLHSRKSGALVMSNRTGLAVLHYLRTGIGRSELVTRISACENVSKTDAEALVDETISAWQSAGLLDVEYRSFPGEIPYRRPAKHGVEHHFSLAGRQVRLRSENAELAAQVDTLLSPYQDEIQDEVAVSIDALQTPNGLLVFANQTPVWGLASQDEARYLVLRESVEGLCGAQDVAAVLHAGCASKAGSGVLLAGASGCGKSTLTLGLVDAGWTYVGDDLIGLSRDGTGTIALPMPAGLKIGSRQLNAIQALKSQGAIRQPSPRSDVEYLLPQRLANPGTAVELRAIIFPKWGAHLACDTAPLSPEEAFSRLLKSGSEMSRRSSSVAPLANLLNKVPSYSLQYSEMKEAIQACCNFRAPARV